MIDLDEFEEGKIVIKGNEIQGYYHKKSNVFYPLEEFIDLLISDHNDCLNKIDGLSIQNDDLKKENNDLKERLDKGFKRDLNSTQDLLNEGRKNGIKEVCNVIYDRQHFYMNEQAAAGLYPMYSDVVEQLRRKNLWIL